VRPLALAFALGLAALALGVRGQENAPPPELANARRDVKELEDRLRKLEEAQSGLGRERERLALELKVAAGRVREAEAETDEAARAVAAAAAASEASQQQLQAAVGRLRVQLSLLALLGRAGLTPLIAEAIASGGGDVPRRVTVALALFREEKRRRDEAATLMQRRESTLAELSVRREELKSTAAHLAERKGASRPAWPRSRRSAARARSRWRTRGRTRPASSGCGAW